jgi:hypothetical protein
MAGFQPVFVTGGNDTRFAPQKPIEKTNITAKYSSREGIKGCVPFESVASWDSEVRRASSLPGFIGIPLASTVLRRQKSGDS